MLSTELDVLAIPQVPVINAIVQYRRESYIAQTRFFGLYFHTADIIRLSSTTWT